MTHAATSGPVGLFAGLLTLDVHHLLPEYPLVNTKGWADHTELYAGGPAANAAVTFAHLGGVARLYTVAGRSWLADTIRDDLGRHGVELIDLSPDRTEPPPVSSILSTGYDRTVITSPAPAGTDRLPDGLPESANILLVDGHFPHLAMSAATEARSHGITVVLDGGSWKPVLPELLPLVDVAVCSADFHPPGTTTLDEAIEALAHSGIRRCAVTRGEKAVVFRDERGSGEIEVPEVQVADTLGAGDVFHGAFCFALAGGAPFAEALRLAAETASLSCQRFGTRAWMENSD